MAIGLPTNHQARDKKTAIGIATAAAIFLLYAVGFMRPWGAEPGTPRAFDDYWSGVASASDFVSFWTGASLVREGAGSGLYEMGLQQKFQTALRAPLFSGERLVNRLDPYHNPPPLALLFVPLTLLPLSWAFLVWGSLNVAALMVAFALPLRGSSISWSPVAVMMASGAVADSLLWGQADSVFALALTVGLLLIVARRYFLGGLVLGILWLKPQYALVFPLIFLYKRRWSELAGMATAGVIVTALTVSMIGLDGLVQYVKVLRDVGGFVPPESSFIFPELMVNWRAVLVNLWPDLPPDIGGVLVDALGLGTLILSLAAWRGKYDPESGIFPYQILVAVVAAVVASPHSHLHGITLLFPAISIVVARGDRALLPRLVGGALFTAGLVLTWAGWLMVSTRWLLAPLLLLSMAVFLLVLSRSSSRVTMRQEARA